MPRLVAPWFVFAVAGAFWSCASDPEWPSPSGESGEESTPLADDSGDEGDVPVQDAIGIDQGGLFETDAGGTAESDGMISDAVEPVLPDAQLADEVEEPRPPHEASIVDQVVRDIGGREVDLRSYRGRPLLIVNVASRCGYTPQYADLQEIYETYSAEGLEILAFPSNQFGEQEPGTEEEISEFCTTNYGITFPLFAKIDVNGNKRDPVYRTLCEESAAEFQGDIAWNFTKFLISADGEVVGRWSSSVLPTSDAIVGAIELELAAGE